jgi:integrase
MGKISIVERFKNPTTGKWTMKMVDASLVAAKNLSPGQDYSGKFMLCWYADRETGAKQKKVFVPVKGERLSDALKEMRIREYRDQAKADGLVVQDSNLGPKLSTAVTVYLEDVAQSRRPATLALQRYALNEFLAWTSLSFVGEITRSVLLSYKTYLSKQGNVPATIANKLKRIGQFRKLMMHEDHNIVKAADIRVVETMPETYSQEELDKFFAVCTPDQHLLFTTFLQSGCRLQELLYLYWSDLDLNRGILTVRAKPEFDFTTKTGREREIPLPQDLVARLAEAKKQAVGRLVFPSRDRGPGRKWLRLCKAVGCKAGLNCGVCYGCQSLNECEHVYIHKFRASFATTCLQSGMDIQTVKYLLGHNSIESTMRYLAPLRGEQLRGKVNAVWASGK